MRVLIFLFAFTALTAAPLQAQLAKQQLVYEGLCGYWSGTIENRYSGETRNVALDIQLSYDGSMLMLHMFRHDTEQLTERVDLYTYEADSLLLTTLRAGSGNMLQQKYTVQGLQKVSNPGQWVLRRFLREGTPFVRITDVRQNDSLLVVREESDDRATWRVHTVLRLASHSRPEPVLLQLPGYERAQRVSVIGNFNAWTAGIVPMRKTRTGWEVRMFLPPGEYQYQFWVDGKTMQNPLSSSMISDGTGSYRSLLTVP
ncbi:hypothetical protein KQI65_16390 [bacterium]|nr:hypothetical protein [bacterium]